MRISIQAFRVASLGLGALTSIALSGMTIAGSGGGDPKAPNAPSASIDGESSDDGRSEDGIGTGPIIADLGGAGAGFGILLPNTGVTQVLGTINGTGSVLVEDLGNGQSLVSLTGNMSFQLSLQQVIAQGIQVTQPAGNTVGRTLSKGSKLIFVQGVR